MEGGVDRGHVNNHGSGHKGGTNGNRVNTSNCDARRFVDAVNSVKLREEVTTTDRRRNGMGKQTVNGGIKADGSWHRWSNKERWESVFKKIVATNGTILALQNYRMGGNQNMIFGRVQVHAINKGLIREELGAKVKGKIHRVSVVEEIRDIVCLNVQEVGFSENISRIDRSDGEEDGMKEDDGRICKSNMGFGDQNNKEDEGSICSREMNVGEFLKDDLGTINEKEDCIFNKSHRGIYINNYNCNNREGEKNKLYIHNDYDINEFAYGNKVGMGDNIRLEPVHENKGNGPGPDQVLGHVGSKDLVCHGNKENGKEYGTIREGSGRQMSTMNIEGEIHKKT
nr:transposon TX1 [Tanacetum cinerariifolium]